VADFLIDPAAPGFERISLPWPKFIRDPYQIRRSFGERHDLMRAKRIKPLGHGREFGKYRIHKGRFSELAHRNEHLIAAKGLPVAATLEGDLVASVCAVTLWVHPEHRGKGLATEMVIDRFLYTGDGLGRDANREGIMNYTQEGFATLRAAYRLLVARGIIDPGPLGVP
jgi:GNAT superfamily N-acetyltransferase